MLLKSLLKEEPSRPAKVPVGSKIALILGRYVKEQNVAKMGQKSSELMSKFLHWLEHNAHLFPEGGGKRAYAEVMSYRKALQTGKLTDRQAQRLARRLTTGVVVLALLVVTKKPRHKVALEILASIPFLRNPEVSAAVAKFLGKRLQGLFHVAPIVAETTSRFAKKAADAATETVKRRSARTS